MIYTQASRRALLGVPDDAVRGIRSSSEPYALLKARTIRERLGDDLGPRPRPAPPAPPATGTVTPPVIPASRSPVRSSGPSPSRRARADREANMWAFTRAALDLCSSACIKEAETQAQR